MDDYNICGKLSHLARFGVTGENIVGLPILDETGKQIGTIHRFDGENWYGNVDSFTFNYIRPGTTCSMEVRK